MPPGHASSGCRRTDGQKQAGWTERAGTSYTHDRSFLPDVLMPASKPADPTEQPAKILVGKSDQSYRYLTLGFGNRHGLVTGATGTGKTVTLQILAEGFSASACRSSPPTSRATCRHQPWPGDRKAAASERAQDDRRHRLRPIAFPVDLLGHLRRAGPSGPRHDLGDGAAAPCPAARPQRHAGRRAQHRLQARRRARPAASRSQGFARRPAIMSATSRGI